MNDNEAIVDFFSKLMVFTNQMKSSGEKIFELQNMKKVLRAILAKFDHVVVAIEDCKEAWRIARISWSSWVKAKTDKFIKGVWTSLASQILQETERRILKNNKGKEKWKKKWNESDGTGKNSRSQGDKQQWCSSQWIIQKEGEDEKSQMVLFPKVWILC